MGMTITRLRMRIPDLRVQADVTQIKAILASAPGIEKTVVNYEAGIMDLTTAAQDSGANAIRMLQENGYPPTEIERWTTATGAGRTTPHKGVGGDRASARFLPPGADEPEDDVFGAPAPASPEAQEDSRRPRRPAGLQRCSASLARRLHALGPTLSQRAKP